MIEQDKEITLTGNPKMNLGWGDYFFSTKGGRVNNSKVSSYPVLRGGNAELYQVKVYKPNGDLHYTISQKNIYKRDEQLNEECEE